MIKKKRGKYAGMTLWLSLCLLLTGTAGAAADDPLHFYSGKFVFAPSIEVSYEHDSNYYAEATQEVSVNSYVVKPGFKFGYTTPKSSLLFDYFFSANEYSGDNSVSDNNYFGHDLALSVRTQTTDHILVGIDQNYIKSRVTGYLDDLGNEVNREKYGQNNLSPYLFYAFNETWGMGARYTYQVLDYTEDLNEDSIGHKGEFDLKYSLNPTALIKLEYNIWNRDYEKTTPTYLSQQVTIAYEKEYRLFSLNAGLGYHYRQFDCGDIDNFDDVVWNLSAYGEAAKTRYFLSLDRNFNNFGEGQEYYKGLSIHGLIGYLFVEKLDLELAVDFQQREYQNDPKDEDIWVYSGKLSYFFTNRFSMAVKYGYEKRDSNQVDRKYDNQYLALSAKLDFDVTKK